MASLSSAEQPNILFIMADDHTSQAIGAYGGRLQHLNPTPTIDSLAREGMVMENAFCQNAICTPSRASTMLDFAGVPSPDYMDGRSFRGILETGKEPSDWKQSAYYHYWQHMSAHFNPACIAIRTKRYKLIQYYGAKTNANEPQTPPAWELYDLISDPTEDSHQYLQTMTKPSIKK